MKRYAVVLFVLIVALMSVSLVSAQDPGSQGGPGGGPGNGNPEGGPGFGRDTIVLDIVADATGLDRVEILRMMREDNMTLAEIIAAQGGDVDAVAAALEAAITEEINQRTAEQLDNVADLVDNLLYNPMPQGQGGGDRGPGNGQRGDEIPGLAMDAVRAIAAATPLDEREVVEMLREEELTLAEIATANGLDPNAIVAEVTAGATERINEQVVDGDLTQDEADAILAEQGERINEIMNTSLEEARQQAAVKGAVVKATADTLNVTARELAEAVAEGQTLADYVTAQGGDVEAVVTSAAELLQNGINEGVERGRLTEDEAAALSAGLDAAIRAELNEPFERPIRPNRGR